MFEDLLREFDDVIKGKRKRPRGQPSASSSSAPQDQEAVPPPEPPLSKIDERYYTAVDAGWTEIPSQPSAQLWKLALGKKNQHKTITEQMWLRKLEWDAKMTVDQMIKAIMKHDGQAVASPEMEVEPRGRKGRPRSVQPATSRGKPK